MIGENRKIMPYLHMPSMHPVSRDNDLPLSFAQQRLWFLDQLKSESPLYNIPSAIRFRGPLNVEALQQSLDTIVARHEAVRTKFTSVDGSPVQVITAPQSVELPAIDLSELSAVDRQTEVKRLCAKEARRPFDLTSDLMMRARLYCLDKQEHVLLLVIHHIASDGWSMGVLFRDLSVLYEAFSTGGPSQLPELAIQYADFAVWQRQWLKGEVLEEQLEYWKKQLDAAPPLLELPSDRPRPAVQTFQGASRSMMLGKTLSEALGTFKPTGRCYPLHDTTGGFSDIALPIHGSGRYCCRLSYRGSQPSPRSRG